MGLVQSLDGSKAFSFSPGSYCPYCDETLSEHTIEQCGERLAQLTLLVSVNGVRVDPLVLAHR